MFVLMILGLALQIDLPLDRTNLDDYILHHNWLLKWGDTIKCLQKPSL